MGKILGACLATTAAAAVAVPAYRAEFSDYQHEIERDREAAATAEVFLGQIPDFRSDIAVAITALEVEHESNLEEVPEECHLAVLDQEPTSIAQINTAATCSYNEDEIEAAQDILSDIEANKNSLQEYAEGRSYLSLAADIEDAKTVIADARDESIWNDLMDVHYSTINAVIDGNGEIKKTVFDSDSRRELSIDMVLIYACLSIIAAMAAGSLGTIVGRRQRDNTQAKPANVLVLEELNA